MHFRAESGIPGSRFTSGGSPGHCVLYQSSTAYQSLPVQFWEVQFIGARALQKQRFVSDVHPIVEE